MNFSKRLLSIGLSMSLLFSGGVCQCAEPSSWSQTPKKVKGVVATFGLSTAGLLIATLYCASGMHEQRALKDDAITRLDEERCAYHASSERLNDDLSQARKALKESEENSDRHLAGWFEANDVISRIRLESSENIEKLSQKIIVLQQDLQEEKGKSGKLQENLQKEKRKSGALQEDNEHLRMELGLRANQIHGLVFSLERCNSLIKELRNSKGDAECCMYILQLRLTNAMLVEAEKSDNVAVRENLAICRKYLTAKLNEFAIPECYRSPESKERLHRLEERVNAIRRELYGVGDDGNIKDGADLDEPRDDLVMCGMTHAYFLPVDIQYCGDIRIDESSGRVTVHGVSTRCISEWVRQPGRSDNVCVVCQQVANYFTLNDHERHDVHDGE